METFFIEYDTGVPKYLIVRSSMSEGAMQKHYETKHPFQFSVRFILSKHMKYMRTIFPSYRYQVRTFNFDKKPCNLFHYSADNIILECGSGVGNSIGSDNITKYNSKEAMENTTFTGISSIVEEPEEITKEIIDKAKDREEQRAFEEEVHRRLAKKLYEQRINAEVQRRLSTLTEEGIQEVFEMWTGFPFFNKDMASLLKP